MMTLHFIPDLVKSMKGMCPWYTAGFASSQLVMFVMNFIYDEKKITNNSTRQGIFVVGVYLPQQVDHMPF